MPYNPADPVQIKVEIKINGTWITITSRTRAAGNVIIKHARGEGAIQGETSRCDLVIGNDDAWLTEENPMSPWYPYIGRGTEIRVSLTGILASGDARRFAGEIEEMFAIYPGGGSSSMAVTATGTLGVAAQNDDPLGSPMARSMSGISPDDFVPVAYWPFEDESDSVQVASGLPGGTPGTVVGAGMQFAAESDLPGSLPLPSIAEGTYVDLPIPAYTDTGKCTMRLALKVDESPAVDTLFAEYFTPTGPIVQWQLYIAAGSPDSVAVRGLDAAGAVAAGGSTPLNGGGNPTEGDFYGNWWFHSVGSFLDGGLLWGGQQMSDLSDAVSGVAGSSVYTTHAPATRIRVYGHAGVSVGHVGVFPDLSILDEASLLATAGAMSGYTGEQAHERIERLSHEEGKTCSISGTTSAQMGPQRIAKLFDLWRDCEEADQGILSDSIDATGITYRTRTDLYNQAAQVAITVGAITKDLAPKWDNQRTTNDVTVSRMGGSSARVTDEAHVTRTRRRLRTTPIVNLASDGVLAGHAGHRLAIGTTRGPRYADGGINLRNEHGAKLADAVLGTVPGDRLTAAATALPAQHPPHGFDQMVTGWTEELDVDEWVFYPVMSPYSPYLIGVYGTSSTASRWDSADSTLATGYDADDVSLSVVTAAGHARF